MALSFRLPIINLPARILLAMLTLVLIGFGSSMKILELYFKEEKNEYRRERLARKEKAIAAHLSRELERNIDDLKSREDALNVFDSELSAIADIHNMDVALYSMSGDLLISSSSELDEVVTFPPQLPEDLNYQRDEAVLLKSDDAREVLMYASEIKGSNEIPLAVMVVPYSDGVNLPLKDQKFYRSLALLNGLLFLSATLFAYLLSKSITKGLEAVSDAMRSSAKGGDPKVKWSSKDEIGKLVSEYNRMIDVVEKNAKALAQAEKESAWKEIAQQVAHEIKNPLTPMRLMTQMHALKAEDQTKESIKEFSEGMLAQIDAMAQVAGDFSQLTNISSENRKNIDLRELLRECAAAYPNATLLVPESGQYLVLANQNQLLRVLNNLLNNAFEAIPRRRKPLVSFGIHEDDENAILFVRDNGIGIDPDLRSQVFVPQFTTKSRGTGLGLAIVKTIIESFQGRIWVDSTGGDGTEFVFSIPLVKL
jgi:signal transduction histidine kinase